MSRIVGKQASAPPGVAVAGWLAGAGESAAGQALHEGKWIGSGCAVWGEAAYQAALPRRF